MKPKPEWRDAHERALAYKLGIDEKVLTDLKYSFGFYKPSFDPNPTVAAYNEGRRSVILAITNTIARADVPPAEETDARDSADPINGQSAGHESYID